IIGAIVNICVNVLYPKIPSSGIVISLIRSNISLYVQSGDGISTFILLKRFSSKKTVYGRYFAGAAIFLSPSKYPLSFSVVKIVSLSGSFSKYSVKSPNHAFRTAISTLPRYQKTSGNSPRSEEHTSELQSRFDLVC